MIQWEESCLVLFLTNTLMTNALVYELLEENKTTVKSVSRMSFVHVR